MAKKLISWDEVEEALPAIVMAYLLQTFAVKSTETTKLDQAQVDARVQVGIDALIDAAPGALDTLNELAAALGDDPNFATTMTNALAALDAAKSNVGHTHTRANITDATALGRTLMAVADAAAARTAIGAGTSSLTLGTTAGTAAEGDRLQVVSSLPATPKVGVWYGIPE